MQVLADLPEEEDLSDFNQIFTEIENYKNNRICYPTLSEGLPRKTQLEEIREDEIHLKRVALFKSESGVDNGEDPRTWPQEKRKSKVSLNQLPSAVKRITHPNLVKSPQTVSTYSDSSSNSSNSRQTSPVQSPTPKLILAVHDKEDANATAHLNINPTSVTYKLKEQAEAFIPHSRKRTSSQSQFPDGVPTSAPNAMNRFNPNSAAYTPNAMKCPLYNNKFDKESNQIKWQDILSGKDRRTTIMIRNTPNKYSRELLAEELDEEFNNKYDILYLPIDYSNNCNLGFAFINFVNPLHIITFSDAFKGRKWKKFCSEKRCELVYGKIQGKSNWKLHFIKWNTPSHSTVRDQTQSKQAWIKTIKTPHEKIKLPITFLSDFEKIYPRRSYTRTADKNYFVFDDFNNY